MQRLKDLTGNRYGRLVALSYAGDKKWVCTCDCGTTKEVASRHLASGSTRSCGCLRNEESAARRALAYGEASFNHLLHSYKSRAALKGFAFTLSKKEFAELVNSDCEYCGQPPSRVYYSKGSASPYVCNGIDRVDNTLGYTKENSAPCCKFCNRAKSNMSKDDFLDWIGRLVSHRNSCKANIEVV